MPAQEWRDNISGDEAVHLLELAGRAVNSKSLPELAAGVLPYLVKILGVPAAFFYFAEPQTSLFSFLAEGLQSPVNPVIEAICQDYFPRLPIRPDPQPVIVPLSPQEAAQTALFLFQQEGERMGLLGLWLPDNSRLPDLRLAGKAVSMLGRFLLQWHERWQLEKKIARLNAYFAVSSKIAKAMNLRDVIEAILYSSMEAVTAEAASVMLLDDRKENFQFFGLVPPQPAMMNAKFSAQRGLAGKVLESQQSEVINEVQQDPCFYKRFDLETGFRTRNMVAIPLVAGREKVGVLEVLNKAGGESFLEEDRLLLESIAEEIAFALHDARLFEAKQALITEIEKMHQFQTKLIQTSQDGIIASDPQGNVLIFNEGAERILGYQAEEVVGKMNVARLYPPGVAQEVKAKILGSEFGGIGRLQNYETVALSKTGEHIPIELSAILIYEKDNEVATVGFFRDLRERHQLQEKLLQSERLAALGHMAAHISHEVKNPLVIIGGIARQVLRSLATESQKNREKLEIIVEEIRRLEYFLAEVGSFAKLSEMKKEAVNLNTLVRELVLKLEPGLHERNITLSLQLDAELPQGQFAPLHLSQVLLNIVKNSMEAMPHGGSLTLATGCDGDSLFVQIKDTGEGIPPEIKEKIFLPFYSTKPRGSGLGLAISKTIVEAHQGEISIASEPGKGTCVTILLKAKL
uniref:histidine kinase n=1 Tax=Desulfobacca acetoxidans TaxID=60893 RepID=A0A7C3V7C5_9BACT